MGEDKQVKTQMDIREALEKKILTFMTASTYEALPSQMAVERGISFTQLPPTSWDKNDPAATVRILLIDFVSENPTPGKGNYTISDSRKDYTQLFDLIYDLTNMLVMKLDIMTGPPQQEKCVTKLLVATQDTTIPQFTYAVTAMLKLMNGGIINETYKSFVLAVKDNRDALSRR